MLISGILIGRIFQYMTTLSPNSLSLIWTNHAKKRLSERKIEKYLIEATFRQPDKISDSNSHTRIQFIKKIHDRTITLITHKEKNGYVIVSLWAEPPFPGSIDITRKKRYLYYQKSRGIKKIILWILKTIGLYKI